MIIVCEPSPIGSILRLVLGAESKAMIAIHGNLMADITPLVKEVPKDKPLFLSISFVDNELRTLEILKASEVEPPFYSPMTVITPKPIEKTNKKEQVMGKVTIQTGRCHVCNDPDVELIIVKGEKPVCVDCFRINMGLASKHYIKHEKVEESDES